MESHACHAHEMTSTMFNSRADLRIQAGAQYGLQRLGGSKADALLLCRQEADQHACALRQARRRQVCIQLVQPAEALPALVKQTYAAYCCITSSPACRVRAATNSIPF